MNHRKKYLIIAIALAFKFAKGQNNLGYSIVIVDKVPLLIQSEAYLEPGRKSSVIQLITSNVKVYFPASKGDVIADYYQYVRNRITIEKKPIEYRLIYDSKPSNWKLYTGNMPGSSSSINIPILDTTISIRSKIRFEFRFIGSTNIFQYSEIVRDTIRPTIKTYRSLSTSDSIGNRPTLIGSTKIKRELPSYEFATNNNIILTAGKYPQIYLKSFSENKDSCIQYRLRNKEKVVSDWKLTGHILNLDEVRSNNRYDLDIRYVGMDIMKTYNITVAPFWHQLVWVRILIALLTVSVVVFIYKLIHRFKQKNKRRDLALLAAELKNNRNKLDPHFIFNCLATAQSLIEQEKLTEASSYLDDFSDLLRGSLSTSHLEMSSLGQELDVINRYITIQQLRYRFQFNVLVDPELNLELVQFPVMLLQPTVENAIKHGIGFSGFDGEILIQVQKIAGSLVIIITDNGNSSNNTVSAGSGNGLAITRERIAHLQKLHPDTAISYELVHTINGAIARFTFDNWL